MGLIKDDRAGGLNKAKIRAPLAQLAMLPPGAKLVTDQGLVPDFGRGVSKTMQLATGGTPAQWLHGITQYQHPLRVLHQMQTAQGPSAGTVGVRLSPQTRSLYDAAATHLGFTQEPVAQVATRYGLHEGDLAGHTQTFQPALAEMLSNKNPAAEPMSPRYQVNQLTELLARVRQTQLDAAAKAARLTTEQAQGAKRSAWASARDMRLAQSEVPEFKHEYSDYYPNTYNEMMPGNYVGHGTDVPPFDKFKTSQANLFGNIWKLPHFFSAHPDVTSNYSGTALGREMTRTLGGADSPADAAAYLRLHRRDLPPGSTVSAQRFDPVTGNFPAALPELYGNIRVTTSSGSGGLLADKLKNNRELVQDAQQEIGSHQLFKKWLKSPEAKRLKQNRPDLYADVTALQNDSTAQRNLRYARSRVKNPVLSFDPLQQEQRYVINEHSLDRVPHTKLAQIDARNPLRAFADLPPGEIKRLADAYSATVKQYYPDAWKRYQATRQIVRGGQASGRGVTPDTVRLLHAQRETFQVPPYLRGNNNPKDWLGALTAQGTKSKPHFVMRALKKAGYDAVFHHGRGDGPVVVVPNPKQIRDPFVNPKQVLQQHVSEGKNIVANLEQLLNVYQQLGINPENFLPKRR